MILSLLSFKWNVAWSKLLLDDISLTITLHNKKYIKIHNEINKKKHKIFSRIMNYYILFFIIIIKLKKSNQIHTYIYIYRVVALKGIQNTCQPNDCWRLPRGLWDWDWKLMGVMMRAASLAMRCCHCSFSSFDLGKRHWSSSLGFAGEEDIEGHQLPHPSSPPLSPPIHASLSISLSWFLSILIWIWIPEFLGFSIGDGDAVGYGAAACRHG